MDSSESVCDRARKLGLCDLALTVDLRDAVGALEVLEANAVPRADLTVVVVNATECEAASLLLTAHDGTILFFSMATSFTKAALCTEGVFSNARMIIGSGFAEDRGAYALELIASNDPLRDAFEGRV